MKSVKEARKWIKLLQRDMGKISEQLAQYCAEARTKLKRFAIREFVVDMENCVASLQGKMMKLMLSCNIKSARVGKGDV